MKIKNGLKIAVSLFLTGILSSCASHRPPQQPTASLSTPALSPEEAWKENQINLNRIDSWYSEGRIAVSRQHEGESASFIWQQFPEAFFLKLFGPFGSGAMELEGTLTGPDKQVVMRQGNKLNYAATAEDLLYQQVKWRVPLSGLTHWAKGVPVPNQPIDKMILNSNSCPFLLLSRNRRLCLGSNELFFMRQLYLEKQKSMEPPCFFVFKNRKENGFKSIAVFATVLTTAFLLEFLV